MNTIITITKEEKTIIIDTMRNTIETSAPGNVVPFVKLSFNSTHVLKFNKNSISTCNIDMLVYMLDNSNWVNFFSVYSFIKYHGMNTPEELNNVSGTTKAAFYNSFNDNLNAFIEFFKSCSSETRQQIILDHVCFDHDAKMTGIISISTYVGNNKYCQARCNNCDNAICKYCYAASLTNQRYYLKMKLIRIMAILTNVELLKSDIPVLDHELFPFFRIESFGDIVNITQVNNYNLLALCNSKISFTWWTKNPGIIQNAINNGMTLSDNIVIGLSSLYLNKPELCKAQKYSFIRFLFTVYDDDYIKEHNIVINCGAKHCVSCGICYKYLHEFRHGLQLINERKK